MRKTLTLWAALGALFTGTAFGQGQPQRTCATQEVIAQMEKADPGYKIRMEQNEAAIQQYLKHATNNHKTAQLRTIPVVFHVVYNTTAQNVSDAQLLQQITILNRDYRRQNADTISDPAVFRQLGGDTEIEFAIATVDPNGAPTTGITRTSTSVAAFSVNTPNQVKANSTGGKDPWPNTNYLNIWICNMGGGILGYATPPGGPAGSDGVVILYSSLPGGSAAPYNLGRTATHEVGHYLNLKHIWADEAACAADDLVPDTPQQLDKNFGCPAFPLTSGAGAACAGSNTNGSMFMNYMDYTDDACMHMFTKGQRDRMIAALTTSRPTLLTSGATNTFYANFSASNTTIPAGTSISFTDLSTGTPTGWSWTFQGATPGTSTTQNPTNIRYNTPGSYPVTLTITKGTTTATRTIPNYIIVGNPVNCSDTLNLPLTGTTTVYPTFSTPGVKNGYVSGNNGAGDKAKAEYFANTGGFTQVTGGLFQFARAKAAGPNSTVTITVWDNSGTNGAPGTVLASKTLPISTIISDMAASHLTSVTFASPVAVTGAFYMGVQLSNTAGDTVALITNQHNNSPAGRGWEQTSANTWASYSTSRNLNISNAIFPFASATPPVVNFTPANSSICEGGTVTFNSTTTGATSLLWSFPGGTPATSTAANPTVTYATAGSYNVSLKATTTACNMSSTVNRSNIINVGTPPTISVTPATGSVCATNPSPVTLTASGATTYSWSPAAGLNTTTGATVIATPTVTTVYTVTGTTNGCSSTQTVAILSQNPVANFTVNPTVITAGTPVTFSNTSTNSQFYNWNFGYAAAGSTNTSTVRNPPAFTYPVAGTYAITLQTATGTCTNTKTVTIQVLAPNGLEEAYANGNIRIYPNPAKNYLMVEVPKDEKVTEVCLTNAVGQIVASQQPAAGQARLNLNTLASGIYFVKISNEKGSITKKITILP